MVMIAIIRSLVVSGSALFCLMITNQVYAQSYPSHAISLIIPYPPGGPIDVGFRVIAPELGAQLGQSVIIDNRSGAGGIVGAQAMMRAPKDGYTLGVVNNPIAAILPLITPEFRVEPEKDYAPIALALETFTILVARPSLPFRDLKGLVAYAKANPGKLNAGAPGLGSGSHLTFELLKLAAGFDATVIPYSGEAPAITGVLAGQTDVLVATANVKQHLDSGKLIALATSGAQRWDVFPNVPTLRETGVADLIPFLLQ